jgi:hypothetical protein
MKNILIRTGISPLDNFDPAYMIVHNSIGGNVGNLVYAYGVFRTLMTEGTRMTPSYYDDKPGNIEAINEGYDCFVLPLADAFRKGFVKEMRRLTSVIRKLKIPVVIIGAGLRAPFEPHLNEGFPFDDDVKAFISAVLEKSAIIGVRGEITSAYLSRLGFREGVDHMVIGCPSMYAFGDQLHIRRTTITPESMVCVNSSPLSPDNVRAFITRSMKQFPNNYFIPQWLSEMRLTYLGFPPLSSQKANYPGKMSDAPYMTDRVRFFLNIPTWMDFLKQADLTFGSRLHGNMTSVIAGTPSLLIPKDARMRELADYHHLTHIMADQLTDRTNLLDVIQQCDFQEPEKYQKENFDRFIRFLDLNRLDHIYKRDNPPQSVPLDREMAKIKLQPPIRPISACDLTEMVRRWETYHVLLQEAEKKSTRKTADSVRQYQKMLQRKEKETAKLRRQLNRKSVRFVLKITNALSKKKWNRFSLLSIVNLLAYCLQEVS